MDHGSCSHDTNPKQYPAKTPVCMLPPPVNQDILQNTPQKKKSHSLRDETNKDFT